MLLPMMLSPPMKSPAQVTCSGHLLRSPARPSLADFDSKNLGIFA